MGVGSNSINLEEILNMNMTELTMWWVLSFFFAITKVIVRMAMAINFFLCRLAVFLRVFSSLYKIVVAIKVYYKQFYTPDVFAMYDVIGKNKT